MIKNLFYFLYWFYSKSERVKNPSLQSFLNICIVIAFNIATVYNISFLNISKWQEKKKYEGLFLQLYIL